jgi:hypothetical protein
MKVSFFFLFVSLFIAVVFSTTLTNAQNSTTAAAAGTTTTLSPGGTTPSPTRSAYEDTSLVDLIFSFFAEDSDSINSYAVTIAQNLNVPTRRIDFYNVQPGDTTLATDRTPSNTPFGANTMARVTIQPPFFTETNQELAVAVRNRLVDNVAKGDTALSAVFIIGANAINSTTVFTYSVRTVFDLMYTFIIGTMGVAYIGFIGFVIYKIYAANKYAKFERAQRLAEKEARKLKRENMRKAGKLDADVDEDDDENEQIDASRFDEFGGDGEDDEAGQGDYIRDEDGLAIRSLANNVAVMLEDGEGGAGGVRFSEGSRRPAVGVDNKKLLRDLDRLVLPPPSGAAASASSSKRVIETEEL